MSPSPIRLSKHFRPILGWERRVYPPDVVLRRRYCDPRILAAWDALLQHPRILADYYGPIDYWRKHRLAKALLRHPELLALAGSPPDFALAVASKFGFLRFRGAYKATLCCTCGWPVKDSNHQRRCPEETKARRRYRRLRETLSLEAFTHPNLPGAHRASLIEALAGQWKPGRRLFANPIEVAFARPGLGDFYSIVRSVAGPYQASRLWTGLHLKRRLIPHLPGPTGWPARRKLLREIAPEVFRRLPVAPMRGS